MTSMIPLGSQMPPCSLNSAKVICEERVEKSTQNKRMVPTRQLIINSIWTIKEHYSNNSSSQGEPEERP